MYVVSIGVRQFPLLLLSKHLIRAIIVHIFKEEKETKILEKVNKDVGYYIKFIHSYSLQLI